MSRSRMFCPDCEFDLVDVTVGDPCPGCGGDRRQAVVAPEIISTVAVTEEVSYVITKGDQRPWAEQWQRLLRERDVLQSAYSLEGLGSSLDLENIITSFFCDCFHLRDWLKGDLAALPAVTAKDIDDHIHASSPLSIAGAICNTSKHHTRYAGQVTARIREVTVTHKTARGTVEVYWATPNATHHDALDLANQCIDGWRDFLVKFKIPQP